MSHMTVGGRYQSQKVEIKACCAPGEEADLLSRADAMITAVGPRNFSKLKAVVEDFDGPVLCFENDASLPLQMRQWTGRQNIFFVIPDVIASSTSSAEMLAKDPLAITTENGECFVDGALSPPLPGRCHYVSAKELEHQWLAKLYIHNTPHCIAAYLGSWLGVQYLHEAMVHPQIAAVVQGAMDEMVAMLGSRSDMPADFLTAYRDKDLARFANPMLFDPIVRVAREPFRKLEPKDRLLGAAQLCLAAGVVPTHVMVGIIAALCFERTEDPDAHIRYLRRSLGPDQLLRTVFKLRESEALFILLVERWPSILRQLEAIKHE